MSRAGAVLALSLATLALVSCQDEPPPPAPPVNTAEIYCPEQPIALLDQPPACVAVETFAVPPDTAVIPTEKKKWEAALGGETAARPHIKARLAGWPERSLVDPESLPADGRRFLRRVAVDTWRGLAALVDKEHGLPVDNVHFLSGAVDDSNFRVGDYTSTTNLGVYLMAIAAARGLELIAPEDALQRARLLTDTMVQLQTFDDALYNYYDTTSLERTSNFLSFIDSAWCTAGLMVARSAFPELHATLTELIEQHDFGRFYDEGLRRMAHGYDVALQRRSPYHYGLFYTEARLASLIAIGKGDVPEAHWHAMERHQALACGAIGAWLYCSEQTPRTLPLGRLPSQWQGIEYVPSWGGSMFEALMPTLVVDEVGLSPDALGANDHAHAVIQRRYALEQLGYPVWGLSPSMDPRSGRYGEFGVAVLGARGYSERVVTPHASALALAVTPEEAIANLQQLAREHRIYGDFGFYDALDPSTGNVAYSYLVLDQAMILVAIANHLLDGEIQRLFAADPIAQAALPLVEGERLFE